MERIDSTLKKLISDRIAAGLGPSILDIRLMESSPSASLSLWASYTITAITGRGHGTPYLRYTRHQGVAERPARIVEPAKPRKRKILREGGPLKGATRSGC
jgi:hypothetical protein